MNTLDLVHSIINTLEEKKAEEIVLIDIHEIASFTDYFIICTGTSDRMLDSLTKAVLESVKNDFDLTGKYEGRSAGGWLLIDLGDIVVHLFSADQREYYGLELLWERGKVLLHLQ